MQPAMGNNSWVAVDLASVSEDGLISDLTNRPGFMFTGRPDLEPIEGKKEPVAPSSIWANFARTTTGHGFARLVDPKETWWLRAFWTIAIIVLTGVLLSSIFVISYETLVVRGLRREFIVQHNKTMHLPDIHICDTSLFNLSVLEGMNYMFFSSHPCYVHIIYFSWDYVLLLVQTKSRTFEKKTKNVIRHPL